MLEKDSQINEIYNIKNRHNSVKYRHYDYEKDILKKTTSSFLWQNKNMNGYLSLIEKMVALMFEQVNISRNYFNYTVNKYYNDHNG